MAIDDALRNSFRVHESCFADFRRLRLDAFANPRLRHWLHLTGVVVGAAVPAIAAELPTQTMRWTRTAIHDLLVRAFIPLLAPRLPYFPAQLHRLQCSVVFV